MRNRAEYIFILLYRARITPCDCTLKAAREEKKHSGRRNTWLLVNGTKSIKQKKKKSFQTSIATSARDTAYTTITHDLCPGLFLILVPFLDTILPKHGLARSACVLPAPLLYLLLITLNLRDTIISKAVHIILHAKAFT